jgi:hypothetical protein
LISLYILYLALKYRYTVCPQEDTSYVTPSPKPIKVSQIFSKMFQDPGPIPGTIS